MVNFITSHMLCVNRGNMVGNQECGEMCSGTKTLCYPIVQDQFEELEHCLSI